MEDHVIIDDADGGDNTDETPEELFQRNLALFAKVFPAVHDRLKNHKPISKLIYLDNGEPTVDFNGTLIYERGAKTEAKDQIDNFHKYNARIPVGRIEPDSFDLHARKAHKRLVERMSESGFRHSSNLAHKESYFVISVGVGLAQFLDELVEITKCRVLVLVEPNIDFIFHSMHVYDWRPLIERMGKRHAIELYLYSDPANVSAALHGVFRRYNPAGLDGTTVFRHYRTGLTDEIEREFSGKVMTSIMGLGFYQDEINMISQTYKNLEGGKTRMVSAVGKSPEIPCMIVANGPSLDNLLPLIKENSDKAAIFACGSAITTLFESGIKADFWIMTERIKDVHVMVSEVAEKYDVSDVVFIGSSTVFPGVTDFFDHFILFIRPGLSVAPLFATRNDMVLKVPDPLAANSGLSTALHLGFREFYFMGVDVGSKFQDRGHAKGGYYANRDDHIKRLELPVPGNFGGTVWTTPVLKWSKESLEKLTSTTPGRRFFNLSDGALIEKTTPMHFKSAKFKTPKRPKKDIVQALTESCEIYTREEFEDRWDEIAVVDRLPEFCTRLKSAVVDDDMDDFEYGRAVSEILRPVESAGAMEMLIRGSAYNLLIGFEWWNNRIVDPEERKVARQIFKEEFATFVDGMCDRAVEIFMNLEDGMDWTEEFVE